MLQCEQQFRKKLPQASWTREWKVSKQTPFFGSRVVPNIWLNGMIVWGKTSPALPWATRESSSNLTGEIWIWYQPELWNPLPCLKHISDTSGHWSLEQLRLCFGRLSSSNSFHGKKTYHWKIPESLISNWWLPCMAWNSVHFPRAFASFTAPSQR